MALARRVGDPHTLAFALHARCEALLGPDHIAEQVTTALELVREAEATGNLDMAAQGRQWGIMALLQLGDLQGADREIEAYGRLARELRQPARLWYAAVLRAMRALLAGEFVEGEALAHAALALGQPVQPQNATLIFAIQVFAVRAGQGRLAEMEDEARENLARFPGLVALQAGTAYLFSEIGRQEEARQVLERLAAHDFASVPRDVDWLAAMTHLAEVCASLRDPRHAVTLYRLLLPYAERHAVVGAAVSYFGSVSHYLGLLAATSGRWEASTEHFEEALTVHQRIGARPWVARTQHHYAAMLLAWGQVTERDWARELAAAALATARELGMARLAEQAAATQRAAAGRAPRLVPSAFPNRLSEREVQVLHLIGAGRTNAEIAADLVLSIHTVERHITNIYSKLGAGSRAAAIAFAHRHGL